MLEPAHDIVFKMGNDTLSISSIWQDCEHLQAPAKSGQDSRRPQVVRAAKYSRDGICNLVQSSGSQCVRHYGPDEQTCEDAVVSRGRDLKRQGPPQPAAEFSARRGYRSSRAWYPLSGL